MVITQRLGCTAGSRPILHLNQPSFPGPVAGLIFDLGGVLYDDTLWPRWLLQLLHRLGLYTSFPVFYRTWELEYLRWVNCGRWDYWEAMQRFLREAGLSMGQIEEVRAAGRGRKRDFENSIRPLPSVSKTLALLANRGVVLVACNTGPWSSEQTLQRLERLRLHDHFAHVSGALDSHGEWNCDRALNDILDRLDLAPQQTVFISSRAVGLHAARQMQVTACAFNPQEPVDADLQFQRLDPLLTCSVEPRARLNVS